MPKLEIDKVNQSENDLVKRLLQHPELHECVEELLRIVENSDGQAFTADEAEEQIAEQIRRVGQDAMQTWAMRKHKQVEEHYEQKKGYKRREKKLYWMSQFGPITINEQVYRRSEDNKQVRPFAQAARVKCRGYSLRLQRILTDFGAEESFEQASRRVKEHYRIEVNGTSIRRITNNHGEAMKCELENEMKMSKQGAKQLLAETDGTMIPIVQIKAGQGDKRKKRQVVWREAKLCLAGQIGSQTRRYRASLGEVEKVGRQWLSAVVECGGGINTKLHCLGDGAKWIVRQVQAQFGKQARYLVNFYHVSEYLSEASQRIGGEESLKWLRKAQEKMKSNEVEWVLKQLSEHIEEETVGQGEAPVRRCFRYLQERMEYLDYAGAIEKGLPIGSGEIESGHRRIIQKRLKIAGAWWSEEVAEKMLSLRIMRANQDWEGYWSRLRVAHS